MNPNPRDPWARLVHAARQVPDDRDTSAPYGFATRVAALASVQEVNVASLLERFALRAVGVAALLAVLSVAVNYSNLSHAPAATTSAPDEELVSLDDPVALVLDQAD